MELDITVKKQTKETKKGKGKGADKKAKDKKVKAAAFSSILNEEI